MTDKSLVNREAGVRGVRPAARVAWDGERPAYPFVRPGRRPQLL